MYPPRRPFIEQLDYYNGLMLLYDVQNAKFCSQLCKAILQFRRFRQGGECRLEGIRGTSWNLAVFDNFGLASIVVPFHHLEVLA
jgi:hypothetical protein